MHQRAQNYAFHDTKITGSSWSQVSIIRQTLWLTLRRLMLHKPEHELT